MMIKEKNLTNAEKKRIESLDKRIEKIQYKTFLAKDIGSPHK